MLLAAGIANYGVARRLAARHPFARVRDCVAKYHLGQETFHSPGILVTWLDQPQTFAIEPMDFAFRQTALYRNHCRLPAEIAAEEQAEQAALAEERRQAAEQADAPPTAQQLYAQEQARQAELLAQMAQAKATASATLPPELTAAWRQVLMELAPLLPATPFARYLKPAFVAAASAESLRVVLPSAEALEWAEHHFKPQLRRRLGSILHTHSLDVRLCLLEEEGAAG
jgi:hypothetical protein